MTVWAKSYATGLTSARTARVMASGVFAAMATAVAMLEQMLGAVGGDGAGGKWGGVPAREAAADTRPLVDVVMARDAKW